MRFTHAATTALVAVLALCGTSAAGAQDGIGNQLVSVEAVPSVRVVHPGERFFLAFRFTMEPQWHIYYENPGDTGSPTTIDIAAPEGFKVGQIIWSRPSVIGGQFTTYGYEGETILFVPVSAPDELTEGAATFTADIGWLVCKEVCHLGSAEREIVVTTTTAALPDAGPSTGVSINEDEEEEESDEETAADEEEDATDSRTQRGKRFDNPEIEKAFLSLPRNLKRNKRGSMTVQDGRAVLTGPALRQESVAFVPNNSPGVQTKVVEQTVSDDGTFRIVLDVTVDEANTQGKRPTIGGIVNLGLDHDDPSYVVSLPVKQKPARDRTNRNRDRADEGDESDAEDDSGGGDA